MPRPRNAPVTALGQALVEHRKDRSLQTITAEIGVPYTTLSRIERGTHRPSADTARVLARWLGWTTDQVLDAAEQPAGGKDA